jgi:cellulose synthase/poly-beta-1,6-N-acetylglucosamine synthase-like glycosyltransferase
MLVLGFGTVAYAYVGYPLLVWAAAAGRARAGGGEAPTTPASATMADLSVVVPALNEERVIASKLHDLRRQGVPPDRMLVVADGSTDRTGEIARAFGARVLEGRTAMGKGAAVNRGIEAARSEIVILTDANTALSPQAVAAVARCFRDPRVAVVGGVKAVVGDGARGGGEGLYWRIESTVLAGEAAFGATMGVPGELYGVRRSLFRHIPAGVLNDDYHVTCDALIRGYRVGYAPTARAMETVSAGIPDEVERRTRIAAGTWQGTLTHLALADPRRGWVAVAFLSHRVLRSLVTPLLLPVLLGASVALSGHARLARFLLGGQLVWYSLGAIGFATDHKLVAVPFQFLLTNAATMRGAARLILRQQPLVWRRARRGQWIGEAE